MAFEVTEANRIQADKTNKEPQIVLEIDGIDQVYNAVDLQKYIRIGDPGLDIDGTWTIGGLREVEDSNPWITFDGTTTQINQSIDTDKGETSSISKMKISVIDKDGAVSQTITPDDTQDPVFDLLGRKAKIWLGFKESSWREDYFVIFRGYIQGIDSGSGVITFDITHPESSERQEFLPKFEASTAEAINASVTGVTLTTTDGYTAVPFLDGDTITEHLKSYLIIEDEVVRVLSTSGSDVTWMSRGELGTTATSHDSGVDVESLYTLSGTWKDLCLNLLLSEESGPDSGVIASGIDITSFVTINAERSEPDGVYFRGVNLTNTYGINSGDFIQTTGATNSNNNITRQINDLEITEVGDTILFFEFENLVEEIDTSAQATFTKDYNAMFVGAELDNEFVDIQEFERLHDNFLSSFEYYFYIKDTINVREFLDQQLNKPAGVYTIPRKSKISCAYHFPPLPNEEVRVLDTANVVGPDKLKIQRTTSDNFYNSVVYKYEEALLEDKFRRGTLTVSNDSLNRIKNVGNRTLDIEARGMRENLNAENLSKSAANRRLKKFRYGAEFIKGIQVKFDFGYDLEIGDKVIVDIGDLKITDIKNSGTRNGEPRIFEIDNKKVNIKTGEIKIDVIDTSFDLDSRYCLQSPSSLVRSASSQSVFRIKPLTGRTNTRYGSNEYRKWEDKVGASVIVRSSDYSVTGVSEIESVNRNTITLTSDLGFTPSEGYFIELSTYPLQQDQETLIYGFMAPTTGGFDDGSIAYQMI